MNSFSISIHIDTITTISYYLRLNMGIYLQQKQSQLCLIAGQFIKSRLQVGTDADERIKCTQRVFGLMTSIWLISSIKRGLKMT